MKRADSDTTMRLDKWLWCARLFKTRARATQAIRAGRVRLESGRTKPAHCVQLGECISVRRGAWTIEITVTELARGRGPASLAAALYRESDESVARNRDLQLQSHAVHSTLPRTRGRPRKRERRDLVRFVRKNSDGA